MDNYKIVQRENGSKIIFVPKPESNVATIMVAFKVGSKNESDEIAGISHVLEHMHYKGTKKRPTSFLIAEFIESIGAEHNAFTGKEHTGYYAKVAPKHLHAALDFLSDLLVNSTFDSEGLTKEKEVIIQEINMYEDLPAETVCNNFEKVMFGNSPLGRDVIGFKKSVEAIDREKLIEYKEKFYNCDNFAIVIAGNYGGYKQEELVSLIDSTFTLSSEKTTDNIIEKINSIAAPIITQKNTEQSHLSIGFRTISFDHPDYFKLELLATILGGSMSSRMFEEIREKRGLAYSVKTYASNYLESGYITTQVGVLHEKIYEAAEAIIAEYKKIKLEKITKSELDRAKEILIGHMLIRFEDSEELASHYAWEALLPEKILTPEDIANEFQKVTVDDIFEVANKYLTSDRLGFAAIGPGIDQAQIDEKIKVI